MSAPTTTTPIAPSPPEIYEAKAAADGSEAVDRGNRITRAEAEARRRSGKDIVVCGPDVFANCRLAEDIERAITPPGRRCIYHGPHLGPLSLPHFQQDTPPPEGHSFHETPVRRARV
ncbi:MAG: hypothetical protein HYS12_03865 [Planctomycetes bacterium]|nr:hypothetical protein [Planctomycetota bacterium]